MRYINLKKKAIKRRSDPSKKKTMMNGGSSFSASASSSRHNYRQAENDNSADVTMTDSAQDQDQQSQYWRDDFRPLRDAGKNVLQMLRRDETSVHGDLYRRIMSTNPVGRTSISGSSRVSMRTSSSSNVNGTGPGMSSASATRAAASDAESNPAHRYFPSDDDDGNNDSNDIDNDINVDVAGPIKHNQTIPLPPYLQEVRSKAKVAILMGLFPEAELAWMTTDDTVYLWTYHQNSGNANGIRSGGGGENQFLEFRVPSRQPIVSVGLAPPKKGASITILFYIIMYYKYTVHGKQIIRTGIFHEKKRIRVLFFIPYVFH